MSVRFDFYGLVIDVTSPAADIEEEVRRDFAYFHRPTTADPAQVHIDLHFETPSYHNLPAVPSSIITPRNVSFKAGPVSYIDYFGRGLAVYDRQAQRCTVYAADTDLLHEIAYLFILSTVGAYLDKRALHRLHALGVSHKGRAILLLLPSGGGKSTMALELMKQPGFLLLSEDTPLIDRQGRVHPFPLRLGVRPERQTDIPPQYLRTMQRMEFDPKTLIDIDYFADRLGTSVEAGLILVGQRNLGEVSRIESMSFTETMSALVKYMVVGLGVYQGLEFLLERGLWEMLGKAGVVASRLYNSQRLLAHAKAYRFILGRNTALNYQTLLDFIQKSAA